MGFKISVGGKNILEVSADGGGDVVGAADKRFHAWWDRKVDRPLKRKLEGQPAWVQQAAHGASTFARTVTGFYISGGSIYADDAGEQAGQWLLKAMTCWGRCEPSIEGLQAGRNLPPDRPADRAIPDNWPSDGATSEPGVGEQPADFEPGEDPADFEPGELPDDAPEFPERPVAPVAQPDQPVPASPPGAAGASPAAPPPADSNPVGGQPAGGVGAGPQPDTGGWLWEPSAWDLSEGAPEPERSLDGAPYPQNAAGPDASPAYESWVGNYDAGARDEWRRASRGSVEFESSYDRDSREYSEWTRVSKPGMEITVVETRNEHGGEVHRQMMVLTPDAYVVRDDRLSGKTGPTRIEQGSEILPRANTPEQRDIEFQWQFDARVAWAETLAGDDAGALSAPKADTTAQSEPAPKALLPVAAADPKNQMPRGEKTPLAQAPELEPKAPPDELRRAQATDALLNTHNTAPWRPPERVPAAQHAPEDAARETGKSPEPRPERDRPSDGDSGGTRPRVEQRDATTIWPAQRDESRVTIPYRPPPPTPAERLKNEVVSPSSFAGTIAVAAEFGKRGAAAANGFEISLRGGQGGGARYARVYNPGRLAYPGIERRSMPTKWLSDPARLASDSSVKALAEIVDWRAAGKAGAKLGFALSLVGTVADYTLDPAKTVFSYDFGFDLAFDAAKGTLTGAVSGAAGAGISAVLASGAAGAALGSAAPIVGTVAGFVVGVGVGMYVESQVEDLRRDVKEWAD